MAEETTSRGYPLPNPDNIAREDATRIRNAIEAISGDIDALEGDTATASETVTGGVRLATEAEATGGTATNAVPVVKRVKDMITAALNSTLPPAIANAVANLVSTAPATFGYARRDRQRHRR
ncbi:hypothetical protein [Bradyrhizobium retamae]|uniref:Uncharacterized protein n=1 Tax=Bradyrhizobium retamae TaxID=1300035 RepID=A0A0R3MVP2_9BRAD|nr:hypothetical protein [Bradyrhizobium retamae]KRR21712.1 hypothetical protein CQ13_06585 [Bradyrhizobium retamae]